MDDVSERRIDSARRGFAAAFKARRENILGWLSVSPVMVLYAMIAIVPVAFALYASLHEIALTNPDWEYVGLDNYVAVLQQAEFWDALLKGVVYMGGSTILQLVVGVWFALVLHNVARGKKFLSALVFNAYLTPLIVVVFLARFLFDPFVGLFHAIGVEQFGLWEGSIFGDPTLAMPAVIIIGSWKFSIFVTIFTLAQLQAIPDELYEAAKVCGAGAWEMFRDITLPRIKGALLVAIFLRGIFMFNKFDAIWMLTRGGPGTDTTTLPVHAYLETFFNGNYGMGTTIAVIMFVFLAIGGGIYIKLAKPSEEVDT